MQVQRVDDERELFAIMDSLAESKLTSYSFVRVYSGCRGNRAYMLVAYSSNRRDFIRNNDDFLRHVRRISGINEDDIVIRDY